MDLVVPNKRRNQNQDSVLLPFEGPGQICFCHLPDLIYHSVITLDHSSLWEVESCLWKEAFPEMKIFPDMKTFLHCLKACKGLVLRRMLDLWIYQYQVSFGNTWIITCYCVFPGSFEKDDPYSSTKEEMLKRNEELKMRLALYEKGVIFSESCLK